MGSIKDYRPKIVPEMSQEDVISKDPGRARLKRAGYQAVRGEIECGV